MAGEPATAGGRLPGDTPGRGLSTRLLLLLAITAVTVSACTRSDGPGSSGTASGSVGTRAAGAAESVMPTPTGPGAAPASDLSAIRAAIDAINATAGGPVSTQRAELDALVTPEQSGKQRACPAARSTLSFQPAYADLRLAPDGSGEAPPDSSPGAASSAAASASAAVTASTAPGAAGTAYLLPAFIDIYTGDRITGTDLTTLHLWVAHGAARIGALCVS